MALVEGRNPVLEALRSGREVTEVLVARGVERGGPVARVREEADRRGIPVKEVSRSELDSMSARGVHQGVVARTAGFAYTPLEEVLAAGSDRPDSCIVVLDHVTDPGNLGAVVRSAEAFGVAAVVIPSRRAASMDSVALKAAAGAAEHVPVVRVVNVARTLEALKRHGYWVAGASEHASDDSASAPLDGRIALVAGAEGEGLSRLVTERCDFLVRIETPGRTPSLNVAQAVTVLLYEHHRRG